jgi:hypothetical protein
MCRYIRVYIFNEPQTEILALSFSGESYESFRDVAKHVKGNETAWLSEYLLCFWTDWFNSLYYIFLYYPSRCACVYHYFQSMQTNTKKCLVS